VLPLRGRTPCGLNLITSAEIELSRGLTIVENSESRNPIALNPRSAVRQTQLSIVDRPAPSIGVSKNHPSQVTTAWLGTAGPVAKRDDRHTGRRFDVSRVHAT
jgi:hypothetical protein